MWKLVTQKPDEARIAELIESNAALKKLVFFYEEKLDAQEAKMKLMVAPTTLESREIEIIKLRESLELSKQSNTRIFGEISGLNKTIAELRNRLKVLDNWNDEKVQYERTANDARRELTDCRRVVVELKDERESRLKMIAYVGNCAKQIHHEVKKYLGEE